MKDYFCFLEGGDAWQRKKTINCKRERTSGKHAEFTKATGYVPCGKVKEKTHLHFSIGPASPPSNVVPLYDYL